MSRLLLTNCPNCAAPLESDGTCKYCNTKARYANEIDVQTENFNPGFVEILLKVKQGDEIVLFPFQGYMREMSVRGGFTLYERPTVELIFEGFLKDTKDDIKLFSSSVSTLDRSMRRGYNR